MLWTSREAMEPRCRLYLLAPEGPTGAAVSAISDAVSADDVACIALRAGPEGRIDGTQAARLIEIAHTKDVAVVIEGDIDAAQQLSADGVHIDADKALYCSARERLGAGAIIGVNCGRSRHNAMELAEAGVDYVAFDTSSAEDDLIAWWAGLFEVPCVAWLPGQDEEVLKLAQSGADFVALAPDRWAEGDRTPGQAITHWNTMLERLDATQ